jgi:hypothetical protein
LRNSVINRFYPPYAVVSIVIAGAGASVGRLVVGLRKGVPTGGDFGQASDKEKRGRFLGLRLGERIAWWWWWC